MMRTILSFLLIPAAAQGQPCMPHESFIGLLENQYGERLTGIGLQSTSRLWEIWVSPKTGSWTIFTTRPDGISCLVAVGQDWHAERDLPDL